MGCGPSSLKGEPVADIGSAPVPLKKTPNFRTQFSEISYDGGMRKKSLQPDRAPHEAESPGVSVARKKGLVRLESREAKKMPYHDDNEDFADGAMDHSYSHEKYHPGAEHARYAAEQKRNSLAKYHSSVEHAKYRSEHERNSLAKYRSGSEHERYRSEHEKAHQKHETERKQRRADEGLSDEQTGFITSADLMKDEGPAGEPRKKGFLAKVTGEVRQSFSDEEMLKYTGKTYKQIREEAMKGPKAPDRLSKWGSAGGGAGLM